MSNPEINPEYVKASHVCAFITPGGPSIEEQVIMSQKWQAAYERRHHFMKRESEHSVFTRCLDCGNWGVNMPEDPVCGNCQGQNTIEYFPVGKAGTTP